MTEAQERRLEGKTVLVTGGGSGIGEAAAMAFAHEGASLVLAARREEELRRVADRIEELGGTAMTVSVDLTDDGAAEHLVGKVLERFGALDAAFNNAGTLGPQKPIHKLEAADFDAVMAINLRSVWLLMKHEVTAMRAAGSGVIVNTGSFVAAASTPGTSIYAASKAALEAMVRAVALEAGADGIRVNNIAPGVVQTPMSAGLPDGLADRLANQAALKRLGEPADIGDVAVWLCTDAARFITGQTILVDGGFAIPGLR